MGLAAPFQPPAAPSQPPPPPVREADAILPLAQATRETYEAFQPLAPFGPGNPRPLFLARGATVLSSRPVGTGRALRLILRDATGTAAALWPGGEGAEIPTGPVDVAFTLEVEPWHGVPVLQLVVQALQPHRGAAVDSPHPVALPEREAPGPGAHPAEAADRAAAPDLGAPTSPMEWVDRRGTPAHLLAAAYPDAQFLAEGPDAGLAGQVDRYRVRPCTTLVWLTPPPSPRVWDEVLALAAPRRVVLGWPAQPAGRAPFLRTLLGLVRYAAAHRGGAVAVADLACRTGELEAAVVAALEALAAGGALALRPLGPGRLQVALAGTGPARLAPGPARQRLEALLRESAAFRAFLARAPLDALRRALDPR